MSNIRKLSAFRQLSLNCNSPTPEQRRKTLKKQFSEDLPDIRDSWLDSGMGIQISLNAKTSRNLDRPPPIKIAWEDNSELKSEEAVIIKKCKEVRRGSTGKLSRQTSLEKDSILHSKQELAERLRQVVKEKAQEKPNLKIFLAHNSKEQNDDFYNNQMVGDAEPYLEKAFERPKLIQPLITNNVSNDNKNLFQIRKNFRPKINLAEIAYSPTRSSDSNANISRSNTVVVVPMVEKEELITKHEAVDQCNNTPIDAKESDDIKPIDSIIIRPSTAASRREKFQKRTNSAFHATVKEPSNARPPLVRSSSAPSKPDHTKQKFLANKRKVKSAKRGHIRSHSHTVEDELDDNNSNKENPKSQKELNRTTAVNGTEVITMVSLVSPAGSDVEEEAVEVNKEKCKSKNNSGSKRAAKEEKEVPKNLSLRKTVKSVSFQQSSIHAIRSFSASFPARRGSMATALMLGNSIKPTSHGPKVQEKRSTNSSTPDDDERVPKRRLVRSNTEQPKTISCEQPENEVQPEFTDDSEKQTGNANFAVDIKSKIVAEAAEPAAPDVADVNQQEPAPENQDQDQDEVKPKEETKYESPKEKQCWDMYCKMIDKGINVSFDTILRGMLTPTEYRLSRKNSVVVTEEAPDTC